MPRVALGFFMSKKIKLQTTLELLTTQYAQLGIQLLLELKPVKNVNFRYHHPQLRVSAPKHISADQLQALVSKKLDWAHAIYQKHQNRTAQDIKGVFSSDLMLGDRVRFWGETPMLVSQASAQTHDQDKLGFSELVIDSSQQSDASDLIAAYRQQLKTTLSARLSARMQHWVQVTGLTPSKTRIKLMRTRWGSCSQRSGNISISLAIAMYDPECLDALIVHELCHLKHANHGRHFWELVYHYLPNYRQIHSRLS